MGEDSLFTSWLQAGFEGSCMKFWDERRVDVLASTRHDARIAEDYGLIKGLGIRTAREAVRWHRIEQADGSYDWSSWLPMLRASVEQGVQVIWDLCHFGYPDHLDPWSDAFVERFAEYCRAAAQVFARESDAVPFWCPVNEISFWAYAGGDHGHFFPLGVGRGGEWKRQLVKLALAGIEAVRSVDPRARFVHSDPMMHCASADPDEQSAAEARRLSMYESWDMISGKTAPELGGSPDKLDIVGVNFYPNNEIRPDNDVVIGMGEMLYKPFHQMLVEVWERYGRPLTIAETCAEGVNGPGWLRYIMGEARAAHELGVPILGLCIYPIMDYPGWSNDRHCACGPIALDAVYDQRRIVPEMARALALEDRVMGIAGAPAGWRWTAAAAPAAAAARPRAEIEA
jgi:beta-glucosidase/6-phospho-beta-glucosidase/beta-galactosidase